MSTVFIMIDTANCRKVVDAYDYQQIALNNYIDNGFSDSVEYGTNDEACFILSRFDSTVCGLSGEYTDLYQYTQNNIRFLISRNRSKLSGLCGFLNRVTEYI